MAHHDTSCKLLLSQHTLLQLNLCDKNVYFKGLLIHNEISWSKVCWAIAIKGKI